MLILFNQWLHEICHSNMTLLSLLLLLFVGLRTVGFILNFSHLHDSNDNDIEDLVKTVQQTIYCITASSLSVSLSATLTLDLDGFV